MFSDNYAPVIAIRAAFCHSNADVVAIAPKTVDAEEMAAVSGVFVVFAVVVDELDDCGLAVRDAGGYAFKIIAAEIFEPVGLQLVSGGVYLEIDAAAVGVNVSKIIAGCHVLRLLLRHFCEGVVPFEFGHGFHAAEVHADFLAVTCRIFADSIEVYKCVFDFVGGFAAA